MAGEFSFADLVQARQSRRKSGQAAVQPSIRVDTEREEQSSVQPGVQPSVVQTTHIRPNVEFKESEPIITLPMGPVHESTSDDEPISLKRRGKRPAISDPEEIPSETRPRVAEPSMKEDHQFLNLPPSLLGTSVPILSSPRQPGEKEESILFNRSYALRVASAIVPIPDRQYVMSGGLQKAMNDLSISAVQV